MQECCSWKRCGAPQLSVFPPCHISPLHPIRPPCHPSARFGPWPCSSRTELHQHNPAAPGVAAGTAGGLGIVAGRRPDTAAHHFGGAALAVCLLPALQRAERLLFGEIRVGFGARLLARLGSQTSSARPTCLSPCPCLQWNLQQPGSAVILCKRWSFRSSDGACRLFSPDKPGQRNASLPGSGTSPQDQAWYSGTAEQPRVLRPTVVPPSDAAPLQQCLVVATTGGDGAFPGGNGVW